LGLFCANCNTIVIGTSAVLSITNITTHRMKKIIRSVFFASFACMVILGTTQYANAEDPIRPRPYTETRVNGQILDRKIAPELSTQTEIETIVKNEATRCQSLTTEEQKQACYKQVETKIRARFEGEMKNSPALQNILRDVSFKKDGNGKYLINTRTDGEVKRNDDASNMGPKQTRENFSERFNYVTKNLEAVYTRISTLADRIDSRITKLAAENIDVVAAKKFMVTAREELRLAKTSTESAKAAFKSETAVVQVSESNDLKSEFTMPREKIAKTLEHIKNAKTHFKNAHQNLVQAISSLKPGANKATTSIKIDANQR